MIFNHFGCTLPETNVAPENRPLEKEIPIGNPPFSGAMLVFGSVFEGIFPIVLGIQM